MAYSKSTTISINKSYSKSSIVYPFKDKEPVFSLAIKASVQLDGYKSMIRVILVAENGNEFLVMESYYMIAETDKIEFSDYGDETALLNGIIPSRIKIEIENATILLESFSYNNNSLNRLKNEDFLICSELKKKKQDSVKIERINKQIKNLGYSWRANETSVSKLTYHQKMQMLGNPLPNLRGFDYYSGGVFDLADPIRIKSALIQNVTPNVVESFDWRNRHGQNWMTPVRDQGTYGTCAFFAPTGATEAFINLYYNQHIDIDLAEQKPIKCALGGNSLTINYYVSDGAVLESGAPYNPQNSQVCNDVCPNPTEKLKMGGRINLHEFAGYPYTEEGFKKMLIKYGPLSSGSFSMGHDMTMVGFYTRSSDGATVWIFKNSWGLDHGSDGYLELITDVSDLRGGYALLPPITSLNYTESNRICSDNDHDGYYWWGLGPKPNIPDICIPETPDGDDSNPNLGPMDVYGNCAPISSPYVFPEHLVTSSETWNSTYYECGDLIVKIGGSLDLNAATVNLGSNSTFSVELGSTLTFNCGTITHDSGTMEAVVPTLAETTTVKGIACTSAKSGGNVTSDGGGTITARGVCYSTASNPTIADSKTVDPGTTGSWISGSMTIVPETLYYVRSYATNEAGTGYGIQTTYIQNINVPTLAITTAASSITCSSASSGGHVTSDGCGTVTARGICWATTQNPTTANSTSASGYGTGIYTGNLTGLTAGTTYYVRSYAINSVGTAYGEQISFTTPAPVIPVLAATASASSITSNSATSGGNVTSDGCGTLSETGLCWATTSSPTTANSKATSSPATGTFTATITGLSASTTYYVRSYAVNSVGTAYGTEISFTTLAPPVVVPTLASTTTATSIGQTTATSGGNVTSDGGATVTEKGICWSTSQNPTTSNSKAAAGSGNGNFPASMTGLSAGTTYYVRSYATNSAGTGYGAQVSFTTLPVGITASISYQVFSTQPTSIVVGWFANLTSPAPFYNSIPCIITNSNGSGTHTSTGTVAQGQQSSIALETVTYSRLAGSNYNATCTFGTMPTGYVAGQSALLPFQNNDNK